MKDLLAERLLAKVMDWSPKDVAQERPDLQTLALIKYDEYQQFFPGIRFVESLALWLNQFDPDERRIAYDFIRSHLIFISEAEMAHFAAVMYPDYLRPLLLERAANVDGTNTFRIDQIAQSETFQRLQESTVFFGLSDGARIDQFRRSNRELLHEQIFPSYELPKERLEQVPAWTTTKGNGDASMSTVVLLDDFTASGMSYIRQEDGQLKGKLAKFLTNIEDIVDIRNTPVIVAFYVATQQAIENIRSGAEHLRKRFGATLKILPVQILDDRIRITPSSKEPFVKLINNYYDPSAEDEHTRKGGTDLRYGFAGCGLPLVLHHNTPNNSLFLLWVEDNKNVLPLFERFSRHQGES